MRPRLADAVGAAIQKEQGRIPGRQLAVRSQNIILSFLVTLFAMADSQKRRRVGQRHRGSWFLSGLFMAGVQYNRFA
jgi:hypothetical protein